MKYVPNLIPENAKVLPDYFVNGAHNINKASFIKKFCCTAGAVFLYVMALGSMQYPALTILFFIMATGLLLPVHRWLERKLRFTFTSVIKAGVYSVFLIPCFVLMVHYGDKMKVEPQVKAEAKAAPATNVADKTSPAAKSTENTPAPVDNSQAQRLLAVQDSMRVDSLNKDIVLLNNPDKISNISTAEIDKRYNHALTLAHTPEEKTQALKAVEEARKGCIAKLIKTKKYQDALDLLNTLAYNDASDPSTLYQRAFCYDKLGDTEKAVEELKMAMTLGSAEATKLHDKINPERKRVVEYVTRCCDGSTSYSTGRGTCSHHGGVCNWKEPVYETYRKY